MHYLNWVLLISMVCAIVGFWAFTLELIRGRVHRRTTWKQLDSYQREITAFTIVGAATFLTTLIIGAILK